MHAIDSAICLILFSPLFSSLVIADIDIVSDAARLFCRMRYAIIS